MAPQRICVLDSETKHNNMMFLSLSLSKRKQMTSVNALHDIGMRMAKRNVK